MASGCSEEAGEAVCEAVVETSSTVTFLVDGLLTCCTAVPREVIGSLPWITFWSVDAADGCPGPN